MSRDHAGILDRNRAPGADPIPIETRDFTIRQLAAEFSLTYRALRFYEDRGLIMPRHVGGQRVYSQDDREKLKLLVWAKRICFSLTEIQELITEDQQPGGITMRQARLRRDRVDGQLTLLTEQRTEVTAALEELRRHMAGFDDPQDLPGPPEAALACTASA